MHVKSDFKLARKCIKIEIYSNFNFNSDLARQDFGFKFNNEIPARSTNQNYHVNRIARDYAQRTGLKMKRLEKAYATSKEFYASDSSSTATKSD